MPGRGRYLIELPQLDLCLVESFLTPVTLYTSCRAASVHRPWIPQPAPRLNGRMEKQRVPLSELDSFSRFLPLPYRVAVILVAGVFPCS